MIRYFFAILLFLALVVFVRHKYTSAMRQATTKQHPYFPQANVPGDLSRTEESRRKCIMCNGTGRSSIFNFTGDPTKTRTQACPTCRGTGWVDNPIDGR